jgi:hypothetical protein
MERRGEEVHVTTSEARSGSTPHVVRYILAISLALVIAIFAAIVIAGSNRSDQHVPDNAVQHDDAAREPIKGNAAGNAPPAPPGR